MSQDLEHSPGPADQAVANAYDSFAEAYAAETESNLINGYYTRPAVLDLAGDVAGRRILDVGCGAGPLLAALRERGAGVGRLPCRTRSRARSTRTICSQRPSSRQQRK
jgi:predicted TPR repeat methyltransferase